MMYNYLLQLSGGKPCIETGISLVDMLLPRPENPLVEALKQDLRGGFLLFALICVIVFVAMIIDFALGLLKSIVAGRQIRSIRLRDSFVKLIIYYGAILLLFLIDLIFISHDTYDRPYLAMLGGCWAVGSEVLSWFESLEAKERVKAKRSARIVAGAVGSLTSKVDVSHLIESLTSEDTEDKGSDNVGA